ncbi:CocE/NonD family hydrolase [Streptomyces lichenis]|uniref:CocE/NonD family hydrolase n=1 Tax=Streptomyces lichenis TaxID=2306967 RepID=A0ABT0IIC1_9ACTN|nr:CocE/NonD family hydrolase [Streptomyces lichenis]MCK8681082.1 CocE/NonD family hydrolase [Streptomyces lichenis]
MTAVQQVAAADGIRLATEVHLPDGPPGPHPAVLLRTPYDRRAHRAEARGWAARGYAAVLQDVRGRYASEGRWHPYRHETEDGAGTLRWLRAQRWCDGRVVAAGASYAAHCALALALTARAATRPDAVIAAVPALGTAETAREPGGPERLLARAGWWAAHGDRPDSDPAALDRALATDPRLLEHLPVAALPDRLGRPLPSWPQLWRHPRPGPLLRHAGRATVPLLAVGGSRDPFAGDTHRLWASWGAPARLLLGPWGHGLTAQPGPEARPGHRIDLGGLYARWASAALAGRLTEGAAGAVALGGSELWCRATAPAGERRWHLGAPDGLRPLRGTAFTADPARPVRSDTLDIPRSGTPDRCLLLTLPLDRPLDLLGPAELALTASADTAHADWAVRLVALAPDGTADPLAFGAVRRADPPGATAAFTVPLGRLARRLPAGTRLRVEVAGHHFPAHVRQPHTGADPVTATRLLASRRTVRPTGSTLRLAVGRATPIDPAEETCR